MWSYEDFRDEHIVNKSRRPRNILEFGLAVRLNIMEQNCGEKSLNFNGEPRSYNTQTTDSIIRIFLTVFTHYVARKSAEIME